MKSNRFLLAMICSLAVFMAGCRVYSFTGASIEGKTIHVHVIENRARNIAPSLSAALTNKIRNRILSQTGLTPVTTEGPDYDISGFISAYEVSVSGVQNTQEVSQNRLTITIQVTFKNKLNEKANFTQGFSKFADFSASQNLQAVEAQLIDDIGAQLADDIFNKAFVNW